MTAFVGLDGFVDDILHVVDKRENADKYVRLPTIAQLAERLAGAIVEDRLPLPEVAIERRLERGDAHGVDPLRRVVAREAE